MDTTGNLEEDELRSMGDSEHESSSAGNSEEETDPRVQQEVRR